MNTAYARVSPLRRNPFLRGDVGRDEGLDVETGFMIA